MEIKRGWATDWGKVRFDVLVEEVDLLRMLAARGDEGPEATRLCMTTGDVMQIMDAEAQAFVHLSLAKQEPAQREQHMTKIAEYRAERDRLLDKYAPRKSPA
jgi:hypothetical protein